MQGTTAAPGPLVVSTANPRYFTVASDERAILCMTPQPWARTGPGAAKDRKPRFDLTQFDDAFFDRLRERMVAAGERGMYVAVMLPARDQRGQPVRGLRVRRVEPRGRRHERDRVLVHGTRRLRP